MIEPTRSDVDKAITSLAAESLRGKPVGTIAKVTDAFGVKKMGFAWMVKVFGLRRAIKSKIADWTSA